MRLTLMAAFIAMLSVNELEATQSRSERGSYDGNWIATTAERTSDSRRVFVKIEGGVVTSVSYRVWVRCPGGTEIIGDLQFVGSAARIQDNNTFKFAGRAWTDCGDARLSITGSFTPSVSLDGTGSYTAPSRDDQADRKFSWKGAQRQSAVAVTSRNETVATSSEPTQNEGLAITDALKRRKIKVRIEGSPYGETAKITVTKVDHGLQRVLFPAGVSQFQLPRLRDDILSVFNPADAVLDLSSSGTDTLTVSQHGATRIRGGLTLEGSLGGGFDISDRDDLKTALGYRRGLVRQGMTRQEVEGTLGRRESESTAQNIVRWSYPDLTVEFNEDRLVTTVSAARSTASEVPTANEPETSEAALVFYKQGLESSQKGDYKHAVSEFQKAVERDPTFVKPFVARALAARLIARELDSAFLGTVVSDAIKACQRTGDDCGPLSLYLTIPPGEISKKLTKPAAIRDHDEYQRYGLIR